MRMACLLLALLVGCGSTSEVPAGAPAPVDATVAFEAGLAADSGEPVDAPAEADATPATDVAVATDADGSSDAASGPCPAGMAKVEALCVDRYEAYVVEIDALGGEHPHSPYDVIGDASVRARSAGGIVPQGYISQIESAAACARAGKRLCTAAEFALACRGPDAGNDYPYGGVTRAPGDCNEGKGSAMARLFGADAATWTFANFNDPALNQLDGGLSPTGTYPKCVSPYGVYDCVGNLLEWGADPPDRSGHGRLRGGYYGDSELNGPGCLYVTSSHATSYHDYSTGFRCCADVTGGD